MPVVSLFATLLLLAPTAQAPPSAPAEEAGEYLHFDKVELRVQVHADGTQETTLDLAVLLRTSAAVTEFGQIGLPYVDGLGDVAFEHVSVEKADGRRVELKDLKPEDINPFGVSGLPVPADVRVRKVTVPGLEPGDRLSYRVALRQRPLAPNRVFGDTKFMPLVSDPIQTYQLELPRGVPIKVKLREGLGSTWEDVPGPPDRVVRRLRVRVPRPQPGPDGVTEAELAAWSEPDLIFTNFESWDDVGKWWWGFSRERLVADATVKAEAVRIVADRTTPREKMEAIHAFVGSRIRYLSLGFGIGRMQPRAAPDVLASRYGDCKDKHALLQALAAAVGVEVVPALVHSARKDLQDDTPSPGQFDHMISVARLGVEPDKWLWMDGTNDLGPAGYLMPNLRDKRALLIEEGGRGTVMRTPADPPFMPRTEVEAKGSLDVSGVLRAHMRWTFRSDEEIPMRSVFASAPKDRQAEGIKGSLAKSWTDAKVSNVTFSDPADASTPFRVEFDVEKTASGRRSDKEWPLWIPLPEYGLPEPRKQAGAEKAAKFGVREFTIRAVIELPEGTNARPPLSVSLERPFAQFRSAYAAEGRTIRIERTLKLGRGSITVDEVGAYESFRKALGTDREQDFLMGPVAASTSSAETLHAEGEAAFKAGDYARAVDRLRKATEADPKRKDAWNDLGRALRDQGEKEEAIKAFARQIEIDPFDEAAYAERAWVLIGLNRWDDAEKDLLKQIEVAPFRAWSYTKLAERRWAQGRNRESAEYYARAATIEPTEADHLINLGWAHSRDGRKEEARSALARAASLSPKDWQMVSLARAQVSIGDEAAAADVAALALVPLRERLGKVTHANFDENGLYWVARLAEGWQVIGAAALAADNLAKAEKYLMSSWRTAFLPEAAWSLGLLRERQGRASEAARWLSAAESLAGAPWKLPDGYAARAEAARKKAPPESPTDFVMESRIIKLSDSPIEDFGEEVLLLVGDDGAVESVKNVSRKSPAAFDRQMARLGRPKLGLPRPDEPPVKLVLRGLLSCFKLSTCSLVLDIPGTGSIVSGRGN